MPIRYFLAATALACVSTGAVASGPAATEAMPVGCNELKQGQNDAAIAEIRGNSSLAKEDPARLINLGIALARQGEEAQAESYFRTALLSEERVSLQTVEGEWVDSRELARQGLRKLASGAFQRENLASLP